MLASFPPFPSPNPESVSEPLPPSRDKSSSISPRSSLSLDTMTSSFTSLFPTSKSTTSTSSSSSTTTSSAILPDSALLDDHEGDGGHIIDDSHPSIRSRSRRNSARKCVPPHTRLIKSKRSAQSPPPTSLPTSSMDASTSSLDSTGSGSDDGGHVHFIEDVEVLSGSTESLNGCSGGEKMKSSLRRHSQHAYEDSLRIGGGAWHAKKAVTWATTDDEMKKIADIY